jgi:hypothetical protein
MTTGLVLWYWLSTLILATLLYKPVQRAIVVRRVRKLEKALKRETTPEEQEAVKRKAIPLVVAIVMTFAFIFNKVLIGRFYIEP